MKREVELNVDREPPNGWDASSPDCPKLPHTEALKQRKPLCLAGVFTNMQGAVPIYVCEHYKAESFSENDMTIDCVFNQEPTERLTNEEA